MRQFFIFSFFALLFAACSGDTSYADLLKEEEKAIADYIGRNNIRVISSAPADGVWDENDYLLTSSGLYFHLVDAGQAPDADSGDGIELYDGQTILPRYYKITLSAQPDTVFRNWTTVDYPYPQEFRYKSGEAIPAFDEAVSLMKNHKSIAKLIVPSTLGDQIDIDAVMPYTYTLQIRLAD